MRSGRRALHARRRSIGPPPIAACVIIVPYPEPVCEGATMHRHHVSSTSLISVGYDAPSETLELEFSSGAVYRYRTVPELVYDALMRAPSKGRFVNLVVRDAFPYYRIA